MNNLEPNNNKNTVNLAYYLYFLGILIPFVPFAPLIAWTLNFVGRKDPNLYGDHHSKMWRLTLSNLFWSMILLPIVLIEVFVIWHDFHTIERKSQEALIDYLLIWSSVFLVTMALFSWKLFHYYYLLIKNYSRFSKNELFLR